MKKVIITALIVLLPGVVAVGFYRGWFTLSSRSVDAGNSKVNVNLTVDAGKMQADADTVRDQATRLAGKVTEEVKASGDFAKDK